MEYRGYTPDEVNKDKRKSMRFIILLMFPLLLGMFILVGGIVKIATIKVEDVKTISYSSMQEGNEYYFDEMVLIDTYAYVADSTTGYVEMRDYIVSFVDKDGTLVYTSIRTEGYSAFSEKCEAYVENDSLTVGDVILTGCFHGYETGSTLCYYFDKEYELYNAKFPGEKLNWSFYYDDAETMAEYKTEERSHQFFSFILGSLLIVPCIIGIVLQIRKRKELDQYLAEYNNERYIPYNL